MYLLSHAICIREKKPISHITKFNLFLQADNQEGKQEPPNTLGNFAEILRSEGTEFYFHFYRMAF